jgi:CheY-like chemotaxis protein
MTAPSLSGARVLIVEDNFVVADSLRFMISGYGGEVAAIAPSLDKAFAALAAAPLDVAVLDINLAGTNVAPFAEHLRVIGIPFVFLTGYGDADLLPEALRTAPRFDKPVNAEHLVRTLSALTAARR